VREILKNGNPTVLVADDEPALRALARVTLAAQGWNVIEAATPVECLALARRHHPEVLLLDVTFEGQSRDGYSVCRELKAAPDTQNISVVLFTARDDPEGRAFASAVGATAFIVKPFGPLDLAGLLRLLRHGADHDPGIGLYLIEAGVIKPNQLEHAVAAQKLQQGGKVPLGEVLVELGFATPEDVRRALERQRRLRPLASAPPRSRVLLHVVVADDNASVREGLREAFASEADFALAGVAADGAEALRIIRETRPDVVVLDSDMPRLNGIDVLRAVRASMPEVGVVMFTLDDTVREAAMTAGASAVVTKDTPLETLLAELRRAAAPDIKSTAATPPTVVLTARDVPRVAWRVLARRRRAITTIAILLVGYAGGFLVVEPTAGASASLVAIPAVALAGAFFGPEAGIAAALLSALETAALWQGTDHVFGEPVLRIGSNGLGILALAGIGAGFGAMRLLRGRLLPRARQASALAEAALALAPGLGPKTLGTLAAAALEIIPGDIALLYVAVPGGGLEIVGAAGASANVVGHREVAGAVASAARENRAWIIDDLESRPIGVPLPGTRSGVVVPIAGLDSEPCGVIAVLATRKRLYGPSHLEALTSFAGFLASLLNAPPTAVAVAGNSTVVRRDVAAEQP
jgi:CheY-like chemotaxis protein